MRYIGLPNFFIWRPMMVDQGIGGTMKVAKSLALAGGVATARTRSNRFDLPTGLAGNDDAKARMEVMLALAQSDQVKSYASLLKAQTAKIETTSNRASVDTDQIGSLHDMQGGQDAPAR